MSKARRFKKAIAFDAPATVRGLATEILTKVESRKAYADILLDQALKTHVLSSQDRALLTELIYGTLRWRGRLDAELKDFLRRPLQQSDSFIRNLLRLSGYQFSFLHKIPDYAIVNEAVQLARSHGNEKVAGFVNGILRNFLREKGQLKKPNFKASPISEIASFWSHPEWLTERWIRYFGHDETEALLEANNEKAPLVLRVNLLRGDRAALLDRFHRAGIEASPTALAPQGIVIESRIGVEQLPGFQEGLFQVQSEASQLVTNLLDPKPGQRVLDACAAPGGKTTHIAEMINDKGEIVASDISASGLKKLEENCDRLKLKSIHTMKGDLSKSLDRFVREPFDRILVDAPCSGFGTLRSHPEIKWNRGEIDIKRLSELQKTILDGAAVYLKGGGVLVYSTCTLIEDENERIVEDFLARHGEFVLDDAADYLSEEAKSLTRGSYFMSLPSRHNTDGFFAVRMRKLM